MEKLFIERKASNNKQLNRDFFVTGDIGIAYVGKTYGVETVKEYLEQYAKSCYKLLAEEVKEKRIERLLELLE